jgi:serine protease Do
MVSIAIYDTYFVQSKGRMKYNQELALAVAEREMVLSDRFNQAYRSSYPTDFTQAAEMSRKAVVFIKSDSNINKSYSTDQLASINSGSGVVISADGYIVTNNHVIDGAKNIEVTLNDNRVFNAEMVGSDASTDLALLKISSLNLDYLIFGNSDSLQIGEWVMAVGNPFRLQSTVTAGIVSAKARNINLLTNHGIESFIQTDAAVNPGNSGGALINTRGDLMGICTAILSHSGKYEGFSFAVPSNLAKKVINDLKEFGVVQRGWLGIEMENINSKSAADLGLSEVSGVFISSVSKGGSASDAGLRSSDVIINVNNIKTSGTAEFMELVGQLRPGDEIEITYIRDKKIAYTKATLRNQINSTDLVGIRDDAIFKSIGVELRDLDSYEKAVLVPNGIMVVSVKNGSIVGNTKMEPGYIITKINNREVQSVASLKKIMMENKLKTIIFEGFYAKYPGEYPYTFDMPD